MLLSRLVKLVAGLPLAVGLTLAPGAFAKTPVTTIGGGIYFHTPDKLISCDATNGAHGSGLDCQPAKGGSQLTIAWYGTSRFKVDAFPARGFTIPYGQSHNVFSDQDHHTYSCKAYHAAMRCLDVKTKHGFLIGLNVAKTF